MRIGSIQRISNDAVKFLALDELVQARQFSREASRRELYISKKEKLFEGIRGLEEKITALRKDAMHDRVTHCLPFRKHINPSFH